MKKDKEVGVAMFVGLPKPGRKCEMCGDKKCDGECSDDEEMNMELEDEENEYSIEDEEDEDLDITLDEDEEVDEEGIDFEGFAPASAAIIKAVKDNDPVAFEEELMVLFDKWYDAKIG